MLAKTVVLLCTAPLMVMALPTTENAHNVLQRRSYCEDVAADRLRDPDSHAWWGWVCPLFWSGWEARMRGDIRPVKRDVKDHVYSSDEPEFWTGMKEHGYVGADGQWHMGKKDHGYIGPEGNWHYGDWEGIMKNDYADID